MHHLAVVVLLVALLVHAGEPGQAVGEHPRDVGDPCTGCQTWQGMAWQ